MDSIAQHVVTHEDTSTAALSLMSQFAETRQWNEAIIIMENCQALLWGFLWMCSYWANKNVEQVLSFEERDLSCSP